MKDKAKKKIYDKARYAAKRENILAQQVDYRSANKEARSTYYKGYREANLEKIAAKDKAYRETHPEKVQGAKLNKKFGIGLEVVAQMESAQAGVCAVCGRKLKLCVDHCHDTGKVRGLLCSACNLLEGHIRKVGLSPTEFAHRLQAYLDNPPFQQLKEKESAA